jgi:hypothetical protein
MRMKPNVSQARLGGMFGGELRFGCGGFAP